MKKAIKLIISCMLICTAAFFSGCTACTPFDPANDGRFDPSRCVVQSDALTGKTIYWLGSSVTLGMASCDYAVPDYIAAKHGGVCVKDAVSGTTLRGNGGDSYVARLKSGAILKPSGKPDAFVCQVSTNDAKKAHLDKWGEVTASEVTELDSFDVDTTLGALEYVIAYASLTWNCPVYLYTNARFGDEGVRSVGDPKGSDYGRLVEKTKLIADKWNAGGFDVGVIDLFGDDAFNDIPDEDYDFYMYDAVHPYKAGYLKWWTPAVEKVLLEDFGS